MPRTTDCALGWLASRPWLEAMAADRQRDATPPKYLLGACDWSLGKRQDPADFAVAREIGLDGVEVSFGEPRSGKGSRKPLIGRRRAGRVELLPALGPRHGPTRPL